MGISNKHNRWQLVGWPHGFCEPLISRTQKKKKTKKTKKLTSNVTNVIWSKCFIANGDCCPWWLFLSVYDYNCCCKYIIQTRGYCFKL